MIAIDSNKSEQYTLSIRLSADGFSFSIGRDITDDGDMLFVPYPVKASNSMTANLKGMMAEHPELDYKYKQVNILIDTARYTTIPFDLFEDEKLDTLFYHNLTKRDNETVLCNILGKTNIVILFGMDKHTHQLLNDKYQKARIFCSISPIAEHFAIQSRKETGRSLYANFNNDRMDVLAFDHGKLLLANSYTCPQVSDQVYYLLYIWQQLGFNPKNDLLHICGTPAHEEALQTELCKFIKRVEMNSIGKNQINFDIQTLLTCE